jgi:hypothetical protein
MNPFPQPLRFDNKSGVAGVTWNGINHKWRSGIRKDGKSYYLGEFVDLNDAVAARKKKEAELFGDNANEVIA